MKPKSPLPTSCVGSLHVFTGRMNAPLRPSRQMTPIPSALRLALMPAPPALCRALHVATIVPLETSYTCTTAL